MENEILQKLGENQKKLDDILKSIDKARKVFLWTLILSLAFVVLPLIGLIIAIPKFLATYNPVF